MVFVRCSTSNNQYRPDERRSGRSSSSCDGEKHGDKAGRGISFGGTNADAAKKSDVKNA